MDLNYYSASLRLGSTLHMFALLVGCLSVGLGVEWGNKWRERARGDRTGPEYSIQLFIPPQEPPTHVVMVVPDTKRHSRCLQIPNLFFSFLSFHILAFFWLFFIIFLLFPLYFFTF